MTLLSHFLRDASKRTRWGCMNALMRFAINRSNRHLLSRFRERA